MALVRLVFLLAVSTIYVATSLENSGAVPVFIWGDVTKTSSKANPLFSIKNDEFTALLKKEIDNEPFTVVFIEQSLSVEDFSRKYIDGDYSFPYLHSNIGNAIYLPAVESALSAINKLADPKKIDQVKLTENGLSADIEPGSGRYMFITLRDAVEGESRVELLRRHDEFMQNLVEKLHERYSSLVAIYTAENPAWIISESHSRAKRQVAGKSSYTLDNLLLYVQDLVLVDGGNTVSLTNLASSTSTLNNGTELVVKMNFNDNNVVTLYFPHSAGYWYFNKVELTDKDQVTTELRANSEVYALDGFSYRCAQDVSFSSVNTSKAYQLTFKDLKVQPFFNGTSNSSTLVFGDSLNCVGFFTAPIWAGLFVTFILLSIMFFGIMMMMDIRTMDRFDDPKGKTITINASE